MIVGVTGHRPPRLGLSYDAVDEDGLTQFAGQFLRLLAPLGDISCVISGGALGWDMACIRAALDMGVPALVYLPFQNHGSNWPEEQQERVREILSRPRVRTEVLRTLHKSYKTAYLKRDEWLVNDSDQVLALFDGSDDGGTAYTVRYAQQLGKPVRNVYPQFQLWRDVVQSGDFDKNSSSP